jgi:hypothetical protein
MLKLLLSTYPQTISEKIADVKPPRKLFFKPPKNSLHGMERKYPF